MVSCRRCGVDDYCKAGFVRGLQRYKCKGCGCFFTATPRRGKHPAMKAMAVLLYGMGAMSFSLIGRLFGVSDVAVYKWINQAAAGLPEPQIAAETDVVMVDEMWHFVNGKKTKLGSGGPLMLVQGKLSPTMSASVVIEVAKNSSIKWG